MLFEHAAITPQGRLDAIEHLFETIARRDGSVPEPGHVPVEALEVYGAFETPVRHMLEAACNRTKERTLLRHLHKIERELDELPAALMESLRAEPNENWLGFYRRLIHIHSLIAEVDGDTDAEEYAAFLRRMVALADTVSRYSRVKIEAGGSFTLLLMQIELRRQQPKRSKPKRRRKKAAGKSKTATSGK